MANRRARYDRRQRARETRQQGSRGTRRRNLARAPFVVAGGLLAIALVVGGIFLIGPGSSAQSPENPATSSGSESEAQSSNVKIGTRVGERVPEFAMRLADRSTITSEDLVSTGKPVFFYFFATW